MLNERLLFFAVITTAGLDINDTNMVVWNRKMAEVYEFKGDSINIAASFPTTAQSMCLHQGQTLFQAVGSKLNVCNLQGVSTKSVPFTEQEGNPKLLDVNGKFLVVATTRGLIKLFDISRREPRQITGGKRFARKDSKKLIGEIRSVRVNVDGTRVSVLCDRTHTSVLAEPDSNLYVWYPDKDEIKSYEFGPCRYPSSHFWDNNEPRLLACEAMRTGRQRNSSSSGSSSSAMANLGAMNNVSDDADPFADDNYANENNAASYNKTGTDSSKANGKLARQASTRGVPVKRTSMTSSSVQVYTLFATDIPEKGVMLQDSFPLDKGMDALLGLRVPRLFFITKTNLDENHGLPKLKGRTMRDFVGLDARLNDETKRALINFSYYLTIGNMDEAYKAVKLIQNVAVWENMAHMCVKTKRLDVAEVCLGNMGHARGARALREAKSEPEVEAQIAMVAIQLGLLDDAERLYLECGRHDLLNKMLQASGQWEKALEVASQYDRIHLRDTHFKYARYLEALQDNLAAVRNYEASDTHAEQVPRMLFQTGNMDDLEAYVHTCADEKVTRWWGQYCESLGEYERALQVYGEANDELSLVRVHCFMDNTEAAADVALNSSTPAVSFLLARHCEQKGRVKEAMQFFSRSGRYNHAVRLARENGFDSELVNLALRAKPSIMVEVARHLEAKGLNDSAVMLYQKGGNIPRALDLCFRAQLFDMLRSIADSLDSGAMPEAQSSPEILSRCAEFFIEHGQFEKAVHLLVTGKEYERALDLCMAHKVVITDDMAERMTLEKLVATSAKQQQSTKSGSGGGAGSSAEGKVGDKPVAAAANVSSAKAKAHEARRQDLLLRLAKCCKKQGSYHLATKKYTQAGERNKAMKCLLKSGDTDKIIFFAGVSKRAEIYILAANYLQNLDWHNNPNIMKHIMTFYTKAKAYVQLSNFYDACSQVEMDEYRDYDKALGALKEAAKYLKKASTSADGGDDHDFAMDTLNTRISLVERFVHARTRVAADPQEAERICDSLLSHPNLDDAVRAGDVYAMVIEITYKQQKDAAKAYSYMQRMRAQGIALGPYLSEGLVAGILKDQGMAVDVTTYIEGSESGGRAVHNSGSKYVGGGGGGVSDDDDGIEEDIDEDESLYK
jgi:intraflagellar transport protein 140